SDVGKGDAVALLMPNRPEYLAIWLGLVRVGGVAALLNTNLTGPSLAHSIRIARPKHIIVAEDLLAQFETARPHLETNAKIWVHGQGDGRFDRVDRAVEEVSSDPVPASDRPAITIDDPALYIYTSGTTGLPKAANFNHYRIQGAMNGFAAATNATEADRTYVALPLYHSTGGVLAVGTTLTVGGSVVIREKFSAREFWDDIVRNECTMFQYVGELCRYLLNAPTSPNETRHKIRLCNGNGLRPDIWLDFKTRFRIPHILEWYAATEGNVVLFNFDGKPGSIGRIPAWAKHRFPVKLVKFDIEAEAPVRDANGHCIECAPGEVGEALGQIVNDPLKPANRFDGYADPKATEAKILRDVFEPGDAWFRTGDLMRRDELGYFYFVDRIGDTFRWKGENVATSEVSEAISLFPGVREANVYGVRIHGCDGRAGMAALEVGSEIDLDKLRRHIEARLPAYARPLFLRLMPEIEHTGTFKQRKVDLVKEGFDPRAIPDEIWFDNPETRRLERLDAALYERIQSGALRL
ncbi:MAG: long-chain-acyl-CoA synthetase, partial [Pseudomonadota bacterium]|nr:long-chain-acyl-CoA synthetase [Pseudomonadota bacterium]